MPSPSAAQAVSRQKISHAQVLKLAIPVTLSSLLIPLVGIVDTAVIGQLDDAALIGGVAAAGVIANMFLYSFNFLKFSTTGLVAQATGRGDPIEVAAVALRACAIAATAGALALLFQGPLVNMAFYFLDLEAPVRAAAADYLAVRIWSIPMMLSNYAIFGFLLGQGLMGRAFLLQILLNATNIVLSLWFVLHLAMGVEGAAWATFIAETTTALAGCTLLFIRTRACLHEAVKAIADAEKLRSVFRISVDILIRSLALLLTIAAFTRAAAGFDTITLAANMVLLNLFYLSGALLDGVATAAQRLSGRWYGARDRAMFLASVRLLLFWGGLIGATASLVYFVFRTPFVEIMVVEADVREAALRYFFWCALIPLAGGFAFVLDGIFVGATWSRQMRNMMLLSVLTFLIAGPALSHLWGNDGLWLAFLVFIGMRGGTLAFQLSGLVKKEFASA